MVRRTYPQRSVFEVLLPDGDKLWDAELRAIDAVLDADEIVDLVDTALRGRRPQSGRRGRLGTPVVVVLRMLVLKHSPLPGQVDEALDDLLERRRPERCGQADQRLGRSEARGDREVERRQRADLPGLVIVPAPWAGSSPMIFAPESRCEIGGAR
jgi:hypothetical protein